jgi:cytochrome b561
MLAVAMVVVPLALVRGRRSNAAVGITALLAVLAAAGVLLQAVPSWHQQSGVVMAITVPVHVAFALAMRRVGSRVTLATS